MKVPTSASLTLFAFTDVYTESEVKLYTEANGSVKYTAAHDMLISSANSSLIFVPQSILKFNQHPYTGYVKVRLTNANSELLHNIPFGT